MSHFIRKSVLFFGSVFLLFVLLLFVHRQWVASSNSYMLAAKDKHERIAALDGPKLVLVGGSNSAFGWDSKRLEKETGLSVVNMGYYAGHGVDYRLREVEGYLSRGDVVVLSFEYQILHGHMNETLPFLSAYADQRSFDYFGLKNWKQFVDRGVLLGVRGLFRESLSALGGNPPEFEHPYRRDSFNEYGDVVAHLTMQSKARDVFSEDIIEGDWQALNDSIDSINEFIERCGRVGASVCFWLPSLPTGVFEASYPDLERTVFELSRSSSAALLNDLEGVKTVDDLFFDSYYHLGAEGIHDRSVRLIGTLQKSGVLEPRMDANGRE